MTAGGRTTQAGRRVGPWARFVLMVVITAVVLTPLASVLLRAFLGWDGAFSLDGLAAALGSAMSLTWFRNSTLVTAVTVIVTLAVAAPAGYVLARVRGRAVDAFAVTVFGVQTIPIVLFLTPLFVLFLPLGLVDSLAGLMVCFVALSTAVGTWTMSAVFRAVPVEIEEAAWLDGCTVAGAFRRVVLPNAVAGLLSTAVIAFLLAWNDYWIASVFIVSDRNLTLGLALAGNGAPALALLTLLPPLVVFAALHRVFRFGGIGGAVTGS